MENKKLPQISVIVITYNQEELIARALDSILIQVEWGVKDIIVCDDCSTDNNWSVISDYAIKYSKYVRAYRNDFNRGIYGNLQNALTYLTDTDIVYLCSGDDVFCKGIFKGAIQVIQEKELDCQNDAFTIYCDWKTITPKGEELVFRNNLIDRNYDSVSLKLRQLIGNRSCGASISVYKRFSPVPLNRGVSVAENLFDIQLQIHSDKNYYFPFIGSIYYSGIGVSTKMNDKFHLQNLIESYRELLSTLCLTNSDRRYLLFVIERYSYILHRSVCGFFKTWFYYFGSLKYRLDLKYILRNMVVMLIKFW